MTMERVSAVRNRAKALRLNDASMPSECLTNLNVLCSMALIGCDVQASQRNRACGRGGRGR